MPIYLLDKIKPKGGGNFAMVDAEDVSFQGGRLSDILPIAVTQDEYDALVDSDQMQMDKLYLIVSES